MRRLDDGASRRAGVIAAAAAVLLSGIAVYVNSLGVKHFHQPAVYTTAKNLVAAAFLVALTSLWRGRAVPQTRRAGKEHPVATALALLYVGTVGGGIAFILFFDGLAHSSAVPAAFLHDTLIVWVAVLGWFVLGERLSAWHLAAVAVLFIGSAEMTGGLGHLAAARGQGLVLASTVLWAIETVLIKRFLSHLTFQHIALTRMGVGSGVLIGYLGMTGHLHTLVSLTSEQTRWALITGLLLAAYVTAWLNALARARAVDVTGALVGAALITAVINELAGKAPLLAHPVGILMLGAGVLLLLARWPRNLVVDD